MHTVGDAENISKNTVCLAIRKVVAALNTLLIIQYRYTIIQFGNLDGGKRHDDGQASYEPRSLAFSSHNNPPHHRRYLPAHAIRFLQDVFEMNSLLLHFAIICTIGIIGEQFCIWHSYF